MPESVPFQFSIQQPFAFGKFNALLKYLKIILTDNHFSGVLDCERYPNACFNQFQRIEESSFVVQESENQLYFVVVKKQYCNIVRI